MAYRPRILVVGDDAATRDLLCDALEGAGYAVASVETGEPALAKTAATQPDLVVVDTIVRQPDGWDVLRRLRGSDGPGARIPIVACLDRTIDRITAFEHEADHYVLKPFTPDDLLCRVEAFAPSPAKPSARAG